MNAAAEVAPGAIISNKYEVLEIIGRGGMGVVAKARHLRLNTTVALKFIRPELLASSDVLSRFEREARAASRLRSVHANRVLDFERTADGLAFMVLEFLEGETLEERRSRASLHEVEVIRWMRQALIALKEAHRLGIVHRDIKPTNLFLHHPPGESERLVVLDFGVAKSTNPEIEQGLEQTTRGALIGSPSFMAPEQVTPDADVDGRADIWSLGCTMFILVANESPFKGTDLFSLVHAIRNEPPSRLPPSVSGGLAACVARCLEKDPQARFQTLQDLDDALGSVELELADAPTPPRTRSRWQVLAPALVLVLGAVLVGVWRESDRSPRPVPSPEQLLPPVPPSIAQPTPPVDTPTRSLGGDTQPLTPRAKPPATSRASSKGRAPQAEVLPVGGASATPPADAGDEGVFNQRL